MELKHTFFKGVHHITVIVDENRIPHVVEWNKESSYAAKELAMDDRKVKARIESKSKLLKIDEFAADYYDAHFGKFPRAETHTNLCCK